AARLRRSESGSCGNRKFHDKRAAAARPFTLGPDPAAVPFRHGTNDVEPQPGSFQADRMRPRNAVEALENALELALLNAHPAIPHAHNAIFSIHASNFGDDLHVVP